MNEHDLHNRIQQNVLERLKRGVPMRSRAYFIVRLTVLAITSLLVLALTAYVLSFIVFSLHESGEQLLLGFGLRGVQTFLILFPWLPAIVDVLLIVFLDWLLQGFAFGYRVPLLVLFCVTLAASGVIAAVINGTAFNGHLLDLADRGDLPILGQAYENIRGSHRDAGVFRGTITMIDGDQVTITHDDQDHDADDGTQNIVLPPGYATSSLSIGERVFVLGTPTGPVVQADGMEEMSPDQ
ncbi:MAG TPA: hypothetical protein VG102_03385 [Candidatus Paceibacterota bacterium]|jgi:TM2 domain-containing membrane protein YozV|nr:hypothetical protein [Candidatus Paceibacterota bacterium]